ncbi:thermonuclease family protein [Sphingobium sp. IP1]|jgi:endonuclease YncB( thermonuclease family)|uniref:thermonuclease family protein n=1 Tax=Sphingobium sp. IP1 TaxID=2021637 RepID=UPI00211F06C9|nr:thermonuclease family protein [Sphingobium sp. IP1]
MLDKKHMGDVHKFRKPRNSRRHSFQSELPSLRGPKRRRWTRVQSILVIIGLLLGAFLGLKLIGETGFASEEASFQCGSVRVIDGDTFDCGSTRIRLSGIDAPELPGHCRQGRQCTPGDPYAATQNLQKLVAAGAVQCRKTDTDKYGRTVARCTSKGVDLSCGQLSAGQAVRRYGYILCL